MKPCSLFLLVYLLGTIFAGRSSTQINETCTFCLESDATSQFLQCVGLPSTDTGRDQIQKLKGMLEATMDVYTFMKSSLNGVPLLSLDGALEFRPDTDPLQNEALVQMWVEVKIKPLLNSITKHFLSCLSNKNFSCSTYQTIVGEISQYYSEMNPVRQQWLYTFFMYPFLSGGTVSGCVNPGETSEEWLMKNFGAFRAMARLKDFSTLNIVFSGLEVLHLLSPTQKAELLMSPEEENLDNGTLSLVFHSLLTGGSASPSMLPSTYNPYSAYSSQNTLTEVLSGFRTVFTTVGSFAHEFVSFTSQRNVSEIKATTLTQFLLNFTLAELANVYQSESASSVSETLQFDVTSVEGWYKQVVIPVLQRFWPSDEDLMHQNVTLAFHDLFLLHNSVENNSSEIQDVCSMTLDQSPCGLTDAVENVANILHCAARSNLTMTESKVLRLIDELTRRLNSLIKELFTANFAELMTDFKEIFIEGEPPSLTQQHLEDPEFIKLWFQIKLMPLLPDVSPNLLSCLSTKNFSCAAYQTLVAALSDYMRFIEANDTYSLNIYTYFIHPFLRNHGGSDPQCWASSARNSTVWLIENFGIFSVFASIIDFYNLNPYFSGLEALPVLSSLQLAEMLLLPLPTPPDKNVVIDQVFDFLLESPQIWKFPEVLLYVIQLAEEVNPPCDVYIQIFVRMYQAISVLPPDMEPFIWNSIDDLINIAPDECVPMNITCPETQINMTGSNICRSVNSSDLLTYLNTQMQVSCNFPLEKYACAQLEDFTANELASLMGCDLPGNSSQSKVLWKMLLTQLSAVLDPALDILANMPVGMIGPSATEILDVVSELRLSQLTDEQLRDSSIIQLWFSVRLRDFLPFASGRFLHCLTMRNISCQSYQQILQVFIHRFVNMPLQQQLVVLNDFILSFLSAPDSGPGCVSSSNSSAGWLLDNFGPFSEFLSVSQLLNLNHFFNPLDALGLLTVSQLADVSAIPGLLTSPDQVTMMMAYVPDQQFASFFDHFSLAIAHHENALSPLVRAAFLDVVFNRANLSSSWVADSVVSQWLQYRLRPLLIGLLPYQVTSYFQILAGRNCSIVQQGVEDLNFTISTLSADSQQEIYNNIIQTLTGPASLRCYGSNYNSSFYSFVERSFLGFQFPNLTTFLSLMPQDRKHQLVNSMPPSDLASLLNHPNIVDNEANLCDLYSNYDQTPRFLGTESLPADVRRLTLPCVWPTALSSNSWSEVNAWFDLGLQNYLVFLTKSLISSEIIANASCLAFQKLVLVLGNYNYTAADFAKPDFYNTIRVYLTSESTPKCYNSSDPQLNSTAWFVEYIGLFVSFLSLEDLQSFGSEEVIQVFTVNPLNIALLNQSALPQNLTDFYTQLIYQQDSNFNPLLLPFICRCAAPGLAFTQLTAGESMIVLHNINTVCIDLDPEISAALASNFGDNIDDSVIVAMGNDSASMSTGQIIMIKPQDLRNVLNVLATVTGWSEGQADAIIQSLTSSGVFQINSSSSLIYLGSLIVGISTSEVVSISGAQILTASQNPSIVGYLISAPTVVQQFFVSQIITVDSNSEVIIQNVPDEMATEIPRVQLQGFTGSSSVITTLNKKKWERQQAELFFNVIAVETATDVLGSPDNLSSSVLQGFTSTSVRAISTSQVKNLIKACRRTGQNKVPLVETQLTCMYDYISGQPDATSFDLYPPDMLLYYDYSLVPWNSCRFYFEQLSNADFSVFSSVLSYKRTALFENAKGCLGVTNTSLTQDNVSVLGNMCCTLDGSYIVNSDPSILEKLKNCPGLTAAQTAAVEALLTSGNTKYGVTSSWNLNTLTNLGMLPLYLTSNFYKYFDTKTKRSFVKYFLKVLRVNKVSKQKRGKLMEEIRLSILNRSKRSTVTDCTVGIITQVIIRDETFPFDYADLNQFNSCLSAGSVKDNLEAITLKVDQVQYLSIVLSKLREAYNFTTIPEYQVQVLGPASRVATVDDISKWTITMIDTLAALMDSSNGQWDPILAKAIISKYLSVKGNKLGSAELNAIGGPNLCSLDVDVFMNISQQSLRNANALDVSNCTGDKLIQLFNIASQAFASTTRTTVSVTIYQLLQPYISGATADYIKSLVAANISMDLATFTSLNESVVLNLTVSEVQGLLGINLPQLKAYENQTLVQIWISSQLQSELNILNIGLVGGRAATPSQAPNTTSPSSSTNITLSPSLSSNTTTVSPSLTSNTTTLSPSLTSNTTTLSPSLSSNTTALSPSLTSNTTTLSPSLSSNTTTLSPSLTSNTTALSPSLTSNTTALSPSLSSSTTAPSPAPNTAPPSSSNNKPPSSSRTTPYSKPTTIPAKTVSTTPSASLTTKSTTSSPTSTASTTKPTSTAAGSHIRTDVGFSFLVIFTLLISSQQVLM